MTLRVWYYVHDRHVDSDITLVQCKDFDEWGPDPIVIEGKVRPFMVQVL